MGANLGRAALASLLLLGCTGLNPLYADATDGRTASGPGTTMRDVTGPDPSSPTDTSRTTSTTTATTLEPTDASSGSTVGVGPGTADTGTADTGTGSEGTGGSTGGDPSDCSTYDQVDCGKGQKCMPFANDGGTWNALGCFPLDPNPEEPGDPCNVVGGPTSGSDSCDAASMCWDVDPKNNTGTCVAFCVGSPDAPVCDEPTRVCVQSGDGIIALCVPQCDPLLQDCDEEQSCLPAAGGFACLPDASGGGGEVGEGCTFINVCIPGSLCASADALNDCEDPGCCAPFCDLGAGPGVCDSPSVCVPYYEAGMVPAGYENVGFCGAEP